MSRVDSMSRVDMDKYPCPEGVAPQRWREIIEDLSDVAEVRQYQYSAYLLDRAECRAILSRLEARPAPEPAVPDLSRVVAAVVAHGDAESSGTICNLFTDRSQAQRYYGLLGDKVRREIFFASTFYVIPAMPPPTWPIEREVTVGDRTSSVLVHQDGRIVHEGVVRGEAEWEAHHAATIDAIAEYRRRKGDAK